MNGNCIFDPYWFSFVWVASRIWGSQVYISATTLLLLLPHTKNAKRWFNKTGARLTWRKTLRLPRGNTHGWITLQTELKLRQTNIIHPNPRPNSITLKPFIIKRNPCLRTNRGPEVSQVDDWRTHALTCWSMSYLIQAILRSKQRPKPASSIACAWTF